MAVSGGGITTVTSGDTDRIAPNPVTEGEQAKFTITRTKVSGDNVAAKVYLHTSKGTAGEDDFEVIYKQALEFKKNELVKTVSVNTKEDGETDDGEHFALELYKTEAAYDNGDYAAFGRAFITDNVSAANAVANYNYAISGTNNTEGKAVSEGSDITFTVTRTKTSGSDLPTTVYLSTTHSTTGGNDFVSLDKQALAFKADELSKTVIVKTNTDSTTEGTEYFWLDLFKTKAQADSEDYHTFDKGYIKDNTAAANAISNYSYSVTTTASASIGAVTEGSPIEFKITRTKESGDDVASTVYIRTEDSSATSSDYKSLVPTEVTFKKDETEKIITVETYADDITEAKAESFYLDLFKSKSALNTFLDTNDYSKISAYSAAYIKDPAKANVGTFSYLVTTDSLEGSAKTEGTDITVTITRNVSGGSAGESTIYLNTTEGSADVDDYVAQAATPVKFTSSDGDGAKKTITINTRTDGLSESKEYFYVDLFNTIAKAQAGDDYFDFAELYLANGAAPSSVSTTYTITNNSGSSNPRDEGGSITFTISDGNSTSASKIYVATTNATAVAGKDYNQHRCCLRSLQDNLCRRFSEVHLH
ncbi:MAG: hypothetical protein CML37_02590 [Rhodobacteraceae bacterium]|nr:hypothetical protein [Paracoccaceae bacterium]